MKPCPICENSVDLPPMKNLEEQRTRCPHCGATIVTPSHRQIWEAGRRLRAETFRRLGIAMPATFGVEEWTEDGLQVRGALR